MSWKQRKWERWAARTIALGCLGFGLPFYFGYGNPLPFANPDLTWLENVMLTLIPITFFGLAAGWRWERLGGRLVTVSVLLKLVLALVFEREILSFMFVPLAAGVLYLRASAKQRLTGGPE